MTPSKIRFAMAAAQHVSANRVVTFPSYEQRFLASLDRACLELNVTGIIFVIFHEYFEHGNGQCSIDPDAAASYRDNYLEAKKRVEAQGIAYEEIVLHLDDLAEFTNLVCKISWNGTALDMSTMPRSYIMTALRHAVPDIETIIYTQGKNRREGEDAFTIGVRDIVTLPGFEGWVGHRPTLLVMSVGYEGARAYSLYRRYEPTVTVVTLGDPGQEAPDRAQILNIVQRNNGPLFETDGIYLCSLPSYDPCSYTDLLLEQIDKWVNKLVNLHNCSVDVVLSPVGTKPQTLGLFSVWRERPEYQVTYAVPTTRRVGTVDAGGTYWYSRRAQ